MGGQTPPRALVFKQDGERPVKLWHIQILEIACDLRHPHSVYADGLHKFGYM